MLTLQQEREVIARAKAGDQRAIARVLHEWRPLVLQHVRKRRRFNVERQDLISEGNLALLHALERYDPDHGNRFGVYAKWWVMSLVDLYVHRNWSVVTRLNHHKNKIKGAYAAIGDSRADHSLDYRMPSGDALLETLVDEEPLPDENVIEAQELATRRKSLRSRLRHLDKREKIVIAGRWPREGEPQTLAQLSVLLGVTRERVRQLEVRALKKLGVRVRHGEIRWAA